MDDDDGEKSLSMSMAGLDLVWPWLSLVLHGLV